MVCIAANKRKLMTVSMWRAVVFEARSLGICQREREKERQIYSIKLTHKRLKWCGDSFAKYSPSTIQPNKRRKHACSNRPVSDTQQWHWWSQLSLATRSRSLETREDLWQLDSGSETFLEHQDSKIESNLTSRELWSGDCWTKDTRPSW